jgi:hypothetical protein
MPKVLFMIIAIIILTISSSLITEAQTVNDGDADTVATDDTSNGNEFDYFFDSYFSPFNDEKAKNRSIDPQISDIFLKFFGNINRIPVSNSIAPNLPNLTLNAEAKSIHIENCRTPVAEISVNYPQSTGNPAMDEKLANLAKLKFQELEELAIEENLLYETAQDCLDNPDDPPSFLIFLVIFDAYSPRPGIISLLQTTLMDFREHGNHPSSSYNSVSYDVEKAEELGVKDLFPDPEKSLPLFWNLISRRFCSVGPKDDTSLPSFYKANQQCPKPKTEDLLKLPESLSKPNLTLDDLGHAFLTNDSLVLYLDGYEAWSWAYGPVDIRVSKDELIEIGASPTIWNSVPPKAEAAAAQ